MPSSPVELDPHPSLSPSPLSLPHAHCVPGSGPPSPSPLLPILISSTFYPPLSPPCLSGTVCLPVSPPGRVPRPLPEERDEGGVGSRSGEPGRRQWPGRVPLGAPAPQRGKEPFLTPERTGSFQTTARPDSEAPEKVGPLGAEGEGQPLPWGVYEKGTGEAQVPSKARRRA